jgi:hypothetical protein
MQIPHDGEYMELCYVFQFLFQCDNTTQLGMSFLQRNIFNVLDFLLLITRNYFCLTSGSLGSKTKMDLVLSRVNPLVASLGHWFGYCIS